MTPSATIAPQPQPQPQPPPGRPPLPAADGPASPPALPQRVARAWRWLRAFSWPRRFPIVQFPNLPLALAFVAGHAASHLRGPAHAYALGISYLAMGVWAYLELTAGVNWFRRLLGAYYVASTGLHLGHSLGH